MRSSSLGKLPGRSLILLPTIHLLLLVILIIQLLLQLHGAALILVCIVENTVHLLVVLSADAAHWVLRVLHHYHVSVRRADHLHL